MYWFLRFVYKLKVVIVVVTLVVALFFGYWALKIKINPNVTSYLPNSDPAVKSFNEIGENYGGNYLAIVAIQTDDVFNAITLKRISVLTSRLKEIEGISDVISLANIIDIKKGELGIEVGKLFDEYNLPESEADIQKLKQYVLSKDLYRGHIVSEDSKTTLLIVRLQSNADQIKVVKQIKQEVEKSRGSEEIFYAGVPFQLLEINQIIQADLKLLIPIVAGLIGLILFLSFRRVVGVVLPLVTVLISIVITLGIMSILKIPITIISNIIPVIIFAVGSAYSIHIVNRFYEARSTKVTFDPEVMQDLLKRNTVESNNISQIGNKDVLISSEIFFEHSTPIHSATGKPIDLRTLFSEDFRDRTTASELSPTAFLNNISISVILSGITTIAGFISFVFGSYLTMIKEFGLFTSLGVLIALIVSLTFVPAWLFIFSTRSGNKSDFNFKNLPRFSFVNKLNPWLSKAKRMVFIITSVIIILSLLAIPRITRTSDMVEYFRPKSQIRQAEQMMRNKFGGSVPIQIVVKGDIQNPQVLNKISELQTFLSSHPDIDYPRSIVDLITEMSMVIGEGQIIPDSKAKVSNLWFLLEGEEMVNQMVNHDKSEAIIQAMVSSVGTQNSKKMIKDIENYLARHNTEWCSMFLTGSPVIYDHLDKSLIRSQIQSIIIAWVLVFGCLVVVMRSLWIAAIGLIPIIFTLVLVFGFMGYAKIPLDIATVLVGSVSIGIGIDYAIHFLNRYKQEIKQNKHISEALLNTLQTSGRAILINVLTVSIGFLVLVFANLIPLQRFGILVSITMIFSGIGVLIILPTTISIIRFKNNLQQFKKMF